MSLFARSVLLLSLLMRPLSINGKTHVKVTNGLSSGLDLIVHRQSKDDDLGAQHVTSIHSKANGTTLHKKFKIGH